MTKSFLPILAATATLMTLETDVMTSSVLAQESAAVMEPASATADENTNALNARLREAMNRRQEASQETAGQLQSVGTVNTNTSTPAGSANSNKSKLPTRTVKVGGASTMDLGELIRQANEKQQQQASGNNAAGAAQGQTQNTPNQQPPVGVIQNQQPQGNPAGQNVFGQVGQPNAATPGQTQQPEQLYEMFVNGEESSFDLIQVLEFYAEISGRQPIRRVDVNNNPSIYVNFRDLTRQEAMDYLEATLALNGISILEVGDKFFQVIETTEASRMGQPMVEKDKEEYDRLGSFTQRAVQLKYIPTDVAKQVLDPLASAGNEASAVFEIPTNNLLILSDYEPNVKRMLEMIEEIDVNVPLEVDLELIPIRYALADEIAQVLGTLTPSGAVSTGGASSRNSRFGSGRSSRSRTGGLNNNTANQANAVNNATQNRSAFQNRLQNIVSRAAAGEFQILGDTKILPDERTNSILVFANKRDMAMIKQIISKLDVVQAQVLIEAVIMEVSIGENEDLGFSIVNRNPNGVGGSVTDPGLSDTLLAPGQFSVDGSLVPGLPSGFSYFSTIGSDINVAVRALASDRKATVLQRPRIQTFHAREASIIVGERRPFVGSTFFGNNAVGTSSQINYEEISVELHVLPLINQEGLVVLEIEQIVKDLNGFETIDGNRVPVVASRQAMASVAVQDGQTIILGGMITTNKSISHSGVPVLKDIPVMGNLFRSKNETENQVELVVLIKPKVMPTPEIAKDVASEELDKLVATQRAQFQIENSRQQLIDEYELEKAREMNKRNANRSQSRQPGRQFNNNGNRNRKPFENYPIPTEGYPR